MQTQWMNRVHEGMDVMDRDGNKIGKAGETLGRYFNVDAGFLGMTEYYVPFDAVTNVRDGAVWVNATKDRLDAMGWDRRPEEREYATGTTAGATDERTVRLHEEELTPVKERVQTGEVGLRKEVHTERKTMEVPVAREEVVIERHPVDRRPADSADFRPEGQEIRVPVREEQVTVEKRPVVTEEVTVGKRVIHDTQPVSGTVRREEAHIEREGDVDLSGERPTRP